jgi:hypothetical protein
MGAFRSRLGMTGAAEARSAGPAGERTSKRPPGGGGPSSPIRPKRHGGRQKEPRPIRTCL